MYDANEEMKYSGVVREQEPVYEKGEPKKRFSCKNTTLSDTTLTSMASGYLKSLEEE